MNTSFASDEENTPSLVFMIWAKGTKAVGQWEQFCSLDRLVNTVAHRQRATNKYKPASLVDSVEKREKVEAIILKLLQREQFRDAVKFLKN